MQGKDSKRRRRSLDDVCVRDRWARVDPSIPRKIHSALPLTFADVEAHVVHPAVDGGGQNIKAFVACPSTCA